MSKRSKILIFLGAIIVVAVALVILFLTLSKKEKITYTVTFDSDGGSIVEKQIVNQGEKVEKPKDPTKEGFIFVEWQLDDETFDFGSEITEDIELKASWVEVDEAVEVFVVRFDTDGGTTISNQVVEKGSKINKPNDPERSGYTFKGWFVDSNEFDFDSEVVSDVVIVAKWEKEKKEESSSNSSNKNNTTNNNNSNSSGNTIVEKKYTVSFNSNGGSSVASQTVKSGDKANKPNAPTRNGYTFEGWMLNGKLYDFGSKVTSNITLVASWKEVPKVYYTVSFDSNGGSSVASQSVLAGGNVSKPSNPTREGYNFNGWLLNGSSYNFGSAVNGNITLTASWVQKNYTITATPVDTYSPDVVLSVYENGTKISVSAINYSDGVLLCSGSNTTVNKNDISGESSFIVILSGGTRVTATLN